MNITIRALISGGMKLIMFPLVFISFPWIIIGSILDIAFRMKYFQTKDKKNIKRNLISLGGWVVFIVLITLWVILKILEQFLYGSINVHL